MEEIGQTEPEPGPSSRPAPSEGEQRRRTARTTTTSYGSGNVLTSVEEPAEPEEEENQMDEVELKYGASHVINLVVPVTLCMALVVVTMNTITFYNENDGSHLLYAPFVKDTDDTGEKVLMSLGNALVMLGVVIFMTFLLIIFYKYRCYRLIHGWLMMSSFLLLFLFTTIYCQEVMKSFNVSISVITVGFLLLNYGALGMICIHWRGPLRLQQSYLITMSALMALVFIKYLPEWTVWAVLAVISVWDLVAVLAPKGPLRILVETAQERNEPIFPALIYSSGVLYAYTLLTPITIFSATDDREDPVQPDPTAPSTSGLLKQRGAKSKVKRVAQKVRIEVEPVQEFSLTENPEPVDDPDRPSSSSASNVAKTRAYQQRQQQRTHTQQRQVEQSENQQEEKGIKLGLGDFIFYSVLVGKASSYFDWNTTLACYVAILIGLCLTLVLLAVMKRALPALPISIFFGLVFYFSTRWIITPFVTKITAHQWVY